MTWKWSKKIQALQSYSDIIKNKIHQAFFVNALPKGIGIAKIISTKFQIITKAEIGAYQSSSPMYELH